jgi:AraC family transcriptional regulator
MHERMTDKTAQPSDADMINVIGQPLAGAWTALRRFLVDTYEIAPLFNSGGKRYGWNLQHRIGGRPLCEMYPERGSFTALVILGERELDQALGRLETFGPTVRQAVMDSPRYHDGCWMYIRVSDPLTCRQDVQDIEQLILIKKKPPRKKAASS